MERSVLGVLTPSREREREPPWRLWERFLAVPLALPLSEPLVCFFFWERERELLPFRLRLALFLPLALERDREREPSFLPLRDWER